MKIGGLGRNQRYKLGIHNFCTVNVVVAGEAWAKPSRDSGREELKICGRNSWVWENWENEQLGHRCETVREENIFFIIFYFQFFLINMAGQPTASLNRPAPTRNPHGPARIGLLSNGLKKYQPSPLFFWAGRAGPTGLAHIDSSKVTIIIPRDLQKESLYVKISY